MAYYKITVFWNDIDYLFSYRQENNKTVWASIGDQLGRLYADFATEDKGNVSRSYYLPSDLDRDELKKQIADLVQEATGCKEAVIRLSVTELTSDEARKQMENSRCDLKDKAWAKLAADGVPAVEGRPAQKTEDADIKASKEESKPDREPERAKTERVPEHKKEEREEEKKEAASEPFSLLTEAQKLDRIRAGLTAKIRGQQHAVDETVRAVFEMDTFTAKNGEHRGPLSTFLFTGPSGVGKTQLAKTFASLMERECLTVDMSEYSDNLANAKFNGDHGQPAVVTGFVKKHPEGIIIFDEIEKAHINTIHLFLQILDEGRLMDMNSHKEVSFRDTIVIITTNAGKTLYEDPTVYNLSNVPRNVILEALRADKNDTTGEQCFPECITTRFANGRVILFNHLEPYALMQIVKDQLALQARLFTETTGIQVEYDAEKLAALVMFQAGGASDARTLQGLARSVMIGELQSIVMERYAKNSDGVNLIRKILFVVDPLDTPTEIRELFLPSNNVRGLMFVPDGSREMVDAAMPAHTQITLATDAANFKKELRGIVDFVVVDPLMGEKTGDRRPDDLEDIDSAGIELINYVLEYFPEIPVYVANTAGLDAGSFNTLLGRGCKGVVEMNRTSPERYGTDINDLTSSVQINNSVYRLARGGKCLRYNCAQYTLDDTTAIISFDRMKLTLEPKATDRGAMLRPGESGTIHFSDIIGCKAAKEELQRVCDYIRNPREFLLKGQDMGKGILLYGPPGTGKTMLGKAMACEANAAFFQTSATSFFGPLVGQTEQNIRNLFVQARRYAPSVVFIDEVDAVARVRTNSGVNTHNEDALNSLIAEMDGFATDPKRPVYVMAATNYNIDGNGPRVLDPAFVRRFNKRVMIPLPDENDRAEFITKALDRHGMHPNPISDADITSIAAHSTGLSNADLSIVSDAYLKLSEEKGATLATFMEALEDFRYGEAKKTEPEKMKKTAYHEAGHALVSMLTGETPAFLTVVSRGNFGGYMQHGDTEKTEYTRDELMNRVCCALAGRAAEVLVYGEQQGLNTGASSDLENAKALVKAVINDYGMGEHYISNNIETREQMLQEQYQRATSLLSSHRAKLDELVERLVAEHSMEKKALDEFAGTLSGQ